VSIRDRLRGSISRHYTRSRPGSGGAVEALRDTWSRYPSEWKRDPTLNLGAGTLGEEWGGAMIEHARETLSARGVGDNVSFRVLNGVDFEGVAASSVDFIFSYDVQLHLQPQNVFGYLVDARRVQRMGGVFMLHQINLASAGGMSHFLSQYGAETWKRGFDDPRRRGHVYFMSEDQMRALAEEAGFSIERIVSDHGRFNGVAGGRDLIGFLRRKRSRLNTEDPDSLRLVKAAGDETVYAVIGDRRFAFVSAHQFERAGLRWEQVREVSQSELAAIADGGLLEPWE
jgi:hypothetical protein